MSRKDRLNRPKEAILKEADAGWDQFRKTRFQRLFMKIQGILAAPIAGFYVFLDTVLRDVLPSGWRDFLNHEAVAPLVLSAAAGFATAVYWCGPRWWIAFWLIVCGAIFGPFLFRLLS